MKSKIGSILKKNREKQGLAVAQVSKMLINRGLKGAPKTIYGWENGYSEPSADTLIALCDIYEIKDILDAFGYKTKKSPSENSKGDMQRQQLLDYYDEANEAGKQLIVDQAEAVACLPKYKRGREPSNTNRGQTGLPAVE